MVYAFQSVPKLKVLQFIRLRSSYDTHSLPWIGMQEII